MLRSLTPTLVLHANHAVPMSIVMVVEVRQKALVSLAVPVKRGNTVWPVLVALTQPASIAQ